MRKRCHSLSKSLREIQGLIAHRRLYIVPSTPGTLAIKAMARSIFHALIILLLGGAPHAFAAAADSNSVTFIPPQATWKFLDDGSDRGVLWRQAVYNDNGWRSGAGQFGYGEGDEPTRIEPG